LQERDEKVEGLESRLNQKLSPLQQLLEFIPEPIQTVQGQQTDTAYQNFVYCMSNRNKKVYGPNMPSIDYQKAVSEINGMDPTYKNNGISIFNLRVDDNIFCSRLKEDKWFVLTRILENNVYTGCQWASYSDHQSLLNVIRIFFEEDNWFDMLKWKKIKWEDDFSDYEKYLNEV